MEGKKTCKTCKNFVLYYRKLTQTLFVPVGVGSCLREDNNVLAIFDDHKICNFYEDNPDYDDSNVFKELIGDEIDKILSKRLDKK